MNSVFGQHPVRPRGHAGGYPLTPWILTAAMAAAVALTWLAFAAGRITAWVTGKPASGPGYGHTFITALLRGDWATLWPGLSPTAVAVTHGVLLVCTVTPICWGFAWWHARRPRAGDALPSLA